MSTILVTGGAGFIGSHLCEALLKDHHFVVSIDSFNDYYDPALKRENIEEIKLTALDNGIKPSNFVSLEGDIRDAEFLSGVFKTYGFDVIVHLAAYAGVRPSIQNPQLYYDVNIMGTVNLLEEVRKNNIKRFVFASSSSVYGNNEKVPFSESDNVDNPISPYAASKKSGELICYAYHKLYEVSTACLRFFTVYGPRQRPDLAIRKFTKLILEDKEIPVYGDGSTQRDYTFISDIIDGVKKSIDWVCGNNNVYQVFNLGESRTISLSCMIQTLEDALERKAQKTVYPEQPGDVKRTFADVSKAIEILGYNPDTQFPDGIKKFVEWYKEKIL
jgi:UDP-glucuronate 4-epimerase